MQTAFLRRIVGWVIGLLLVVQLAVPVILTAQVEATPTFQIADQSTPTPTPTPNGVECQEIQCG